MNIWTRIKNIWKLSENIVIKDKSSVTDLNGLVEDDKFFSRYKEPKLATIIDMSPEIDLDEDLTNDKN